MRHTPTNTYSDVQIAREKKKKKKTVEILSQPLV